MRRGDRSDRRRPRRLEPRPEPTGTTAVDAPDGPGGSAKSGEERRDVWAVSGDVRLETVLEHLRAVRGILVDELEKSAPDSDRNDTR